ncbi:MAG: pilus assembly protein [Chloroflexota bacterium]|nr:pilus assembly protein [Chloroflexota bacterium]PLS80939.1 MAG: hypothetical protein CYG59_06890 [Chloroflexota bacterium]
MNYRRLLPKTGQSVVEFALIIPLFFMVLFGIFELGYLFTIYTGLTNSAREVARTGATYQYANPTSITTLGDVDGGRKKEMDGTFTATLHPLIDAADVTPTYTYYPVTPSSSIYRYGDKVTVTLTYTHQFFFSRLLFPNNADGKMSIVAESEMRLEPGGR